MITFEISTRTPEEQLRDDALNIVHGYWWPRLGKRQRELLRAKHNQGPGYWGVYYEDRRILTALQRRELVVATPPEPGSQAWWAGAHLWELTPLGREVAALLSKRIF